MAARETRLITRRVREAVALQEELLDRDRQAMIARVALLVACSLREGGKVLLFGNGGSAANAQHIASELLGRFLKERPALPAIALTGSSSTLTALANDFGFDAIFDRQLRALCQPRDVAFGISTSGTSANVLQALRVAREAGAVTVGLTGDGGDAMGKVCDECIRFPSRLTPRIQEGHLLIGHIICELIEVELG